MNGESLMDSVARPRVPFSQIYVDCHPNRPLTDRLPGVTEWSSGEPTFTICPS
jgi:hypothetical protein